MEAPSFELSVRERAGLLDGPRFRVALRSALFGLAGQLENARTSLGPVLSPELIATLAAGDLRVRSAATLQEVYLGVAVTARVRVGVAIQIVQAVVAEVAHRLGPFRRRSLARELPPAWADLLVEPAGDSGSREARAVQRATAHASRQAE